MNSPREHSTPPSPGKRGKLLEETLQVNQALHQARTHLYWGSINAIILSVLVYDVFQRHRHPKMECLAYQIELALSVIFFVNSLFHFAKYILRTFQLNPVCLSPSQKKLLGVKLSDPYFKTFTPDKITSEANKLNFTSETDFNSVTPMNLSALSWLSPSVINDSNTTSPNYSLSSPSWVYHKGTPSPGLLKVTRSPVATTKDFINDEHSLSQYIHDYEEHEKKASVSVSVEQPSNLLSSFWSSPNSRSVNEVSPLLRRCTYQLAPLSPVPATSSPGASPDESGSPSAMHQNQEVWRRLKVDPSMLTQWNANLRMWISQTILQRLVKEFDNVDEAFQRYGLSDMHLGSVGLERLKKTAAIPQIAASIPSLPRLVPFLEITPHQEYLVARIRELAKGGSMSEYRWSSGGSLNGKNWEEHLPTDAAVVMHLIATYLDSQLLPLPHHPDGRPFTTHHFIRSPEKPPKGRNALIIYQVQLNPPHFVLVENDDSLEVTKGRNNLFHTFLLFLHLLKTKEHGMLGRVNLGPSGVNVLWVIDD